MANTGPPGTPEGPRIASLIVRGQGLLLSDVTQIERLASIQALFERLEAQETMMRAPTPPDPSSGEVWRPFTKS